MHHLQRGKILKTGGKDTQDLLGNSDQSRNINVKQGVHMFWWSNLLSKRKEALIFQTLKQLPPCTLPDESHLCSVYGWIFCTVMSESRTPSSTPICRMNIPFCRSVSWLTFTSRIISTRLFFLGSRENVDSTDLQSFYLAAWVQGRFLVSLQDVSDLNTEPENGTVGRDASMTFTGNRSSESQPSKTTGKHKHIPQNFWRLQF